MCMNTLSNSFSFSVVLHTWETLDDVRKFFLLQAAGPGELLLMKSVELPLIHSISSLKSLCMAKFTVAIFLNLISTALNGHNKET